MLTWLRRRLSPLSYVRIDVDRITVRDLGDGRELTASPTRAYSSSRLLVADFRVAADLFERLVRELKRNHWPRPAPVMVMHPVARLEGGLSEVERRVLEELAAGVGARRSIIWQGESLRDSEIRVLAEDGGRGLSDR